LPNRMEIIARTERRGKFSVAEKASILEEADQAGVTVREVAKRHGIAESLIYNWRSAQRQVAALASEPLEFISCPVVPAAPNGAPVEQASLAAPTLPSADASDDMIRPHPGARPGAIEIDLPTGVRPSVDSYVNEKALARVLRTLRAVP